MKSSLAFLGLISGFHAAFTSGAVASKNASSEPINPNQLSAMMSKDALLKKAQYLQAIGDRHNGTRKWGGPGNVETVDWIYDTIKKTGYYDVYKQDFKKMVRIYDQLDVTASDNSHLQVLGVGNGTTGTACGTVTYIDDPCKESSYSKVSSKVVVAYVNATCEAGVMNALAQRAGAVGFLGVYTGIVSQALFHPRARVDVFTWGSLEAANVTKFLPGAAVDLATGSRLVDSVRSGKKVRVTIRSRVHTEQLTMTNVIAQTKSGDKNTVVTTGAHTDSVASGPGINDDGSGIIAQLEVALALAKLKPKLNNAVRFFWWNGEEDGLLGSKHYVDSLPQEDIDKIALNIAWDTIASPNYVYAVYQPGTSANASSAVVRDSLSMTKTMNKFYAANGVPITIPVPLAFGRMDFVSFAMHNIPVGGMSTGTEQIKTADMRALFGGKEGEWHDPCYHRACDTVDNLNMDAWLMNTKLMANFIATYSNSIEGFEFPRKSNGEGETWWEAP